MSLQVFIYVHTVLLYMYNTHSKCKLTKRKDKIKNSLKLFLFISTYLLFAFFSLLIVQKILFVLDA